MMQQDPWAEFEAVEQPAQGGPVYGPPPVVDQAEQRRIQLSERKEDRQASVAERQLDLAEKRFQYQIQQDGQKKGPEAVDPQKLANLQSLETQINRVQTLFNETQKDNTIPLAGSAWEYLPTEANAQFDSASAGLAEQGLAAFRVPGVGSQSDAELRQFVEANRPSTWSFDSANLERLATLRNRVDQTRAALGLPPAKWEGIEEGLPVNVTYEGPNTAYQEQPAQAEQPKAVAPDDIDAIMKKYGSGQ